MDVYKDQEGKFQEIKKLMSFYTDPEVTYLDCNLDDKCDNLSKDIITEKNVDLLVNVNQKNQDDLKNKFGCFVFDKDSKKILLNLCNEEDYEELKTSKKDFY